MSHTTTLHSFANPAIADPLGRYAPRIGGIAVEFFFVLSGFVLTWSVRPGDTTRAFWLRRVTKIYPNNIVACLLAIIGLVITGQAVRPAIALPNVLLVQDWVPIVSVSGGLNRPSWSLGCEVLFYAMFPVLLPLIRRIPDRLLWAAAGCVVAVIAILPTVAHLLPDQGPFTDGLGWPQYWFLYVFPVSRLLEFTLGIVVARIVLADRWIRFGFGPAIWLAAAAVVLNEFVPERYGLVATMIVPLALVVGAGAGADLHGRPSWVRGRVAVWLGEVSFAFYIVHYLVLMYSHQIFAGRVWSWPVAVGNILVLFCIALALANILYVTVERPLVRAMNRRLAARS